MSAPHDSFFSLSLPPSSPAPHPSLPPSLTRQRNIHLLLPRVPLIPIKAQISLFPQQEGRVVSRTVEVEMLGQVHSEDLEDGREGGRDMSRCVKGWIKRPFLQFCYSHTRAQTTTHATIVEPFLAPSLPPSLARSLAPSLRASNPHSPSASPPATTSATDHSTTHPLLPSLLLLLLLLLLQQQHQRKEPPPA
jgi:hypothetical protein